MIISKESAEHYTWGDDCDGWHLIKNSQISIIQERMPPGTCEMRHFHTRSWQFFFMLAGTATMEVDGNIVVLQPQKGIEIRPGVPHQMRNESTDICEFLVYSQPPSHGDRVVVDSAK